MKQVPSPETDVETLPQRQPTARFPRRRRLFVIAWLCHRRNASQVYAAFVVTAGV